MGCHQRAPWCGWFLEARVAMGPFPSPTFTQGQTCKQWKVLLVQYFQNLRKFWGNIEILIFSGEPRDARCEYLDALNDIYLSIINNWDNGI